MVQWIPIDKIQYILHIEPFSVSWIIILLAWLFYLLFLKKISEKRHNNLRGRFFSTIIYLISASLITLLHWYSFDHFSQDLFALKLTNYLGLLALIVGAIAVVKLAQILVYLYLFFSHMSNGIPILIGNMFTFIFSLLILSLIGSNVFGINVATLIATSAIFSIVLGLALQDTLGNFFSGVALQIDRPFKIGDWVEVHGADEQWTGQIQEITWRATFLLSFSDELIMIPNKSIAQSQILIFSQNQKPARFNHTFHFNFDVKIDEAKEALYAGLQTVPGILEYPEPIALVIDITESYINMKIIYSIADFGTRYRKGDAVMIAILKTIHQRGLKLALPGLKITQS